MNTEQIERYPIKADRHSSHSQIVSVCGSGNGRTLLDVGCARGHLTSLLRENGWSVQGIEYDEDDARVAQEKGIPITRDTAETALTNIADSFDVIVFADVLEHFVDPQYVLQLAKRRLNPGGQIVISIPNVAHLSVRLQLLFGSFTYTDRGILDRTHLHFYTKKTLRELVNSSGFEIDHIGATPVPIEEVFPVLRRVKPLRAVLEMNAWLARIWKSALAYQYILVCRAA